MYESSRISDKVKTRPSKPLVDMLNANALLGSVLDFGCGKGTDVEYLKLLRPHRMVAGYDPTYFPDFPDEMFDNVFCKNVINYIAQKGLIKQTLLKATSKLNKNGKLIIIARTVAEVKANVNRNTNWEYYAPDKGYYSETGTFQRGYDTNELVQWIESIELINVSKKFNIPPVQYSWVIAQKID